MLIALLLTAFAAVTLVPAAVALHTLYKAIPRSNADFQWTDL